MQKVECTVFLKWLKKKKEQDLTIWTQNVYKKARNYKEKKYDS